MISPTGSKETTTGTGHSIRSEDSPSLTEPFINNTRGGNTWSKTKSFEIGATQTVGNEEPRRSILDDIFLVYNDGFDSPRPTTLADVPEVMASKSLGAKLWIFTRILLFFGLSALPFILYTTSEIKKAWYSPLMGILAAALPSGGMPVAGGIVFYPILTTFSDLNTTEVVEFSAATQLIGVGIMGPLNWYFKKPEVFMPPPIMISIVTGGITMFLSWMFLKDVPSKMVEIVFLIFAIFVAGYVAYGLITGALHSQSDTIEYNKVMVIALIISAIFGGMLVFLIGIGIEKTTFTALTSVQHGDARNAAVSSITIVGLLSAVAVALRGIPPGPRLYWLVGLPGILLGSTIGPWLNSALGKKNIMRLFLVLLIAEIAKSLIQLIHG